MSHTSSPAIQLLAPSLVIPRPQAEAQARNLALTNRVVGGILISQSRSRAGVCDERFRHLQGTCQVDELSSEPFGSDPVFVQSSSLFDGSLRASDYYTSNELNALGARHDTAEVPDHTPPHAEPPQLTAGCSSVFASSMIVVVVRSPPDAAPPLSTRRGALW